MTNCGKAFGEEKLRMRSSRKGSGMNGCMWSVNQSIRNNEYESVSDLVSGRAHGGRG